MHGILQATCNPTLTLTLMTWRAGSGTCACWRTPSRRSVAISRSRLRRQSANSLAAFSIWRASATCRPTPRASQTVRTDAPGAAPTETLPQRGHHGYCHSRQLRGVTQQLLPWVACPPCAQPPSHLNSLCARRRRAHACSLPVACISASGRSSPRAARAGAAPRLLLLDDLDVGLQVPALLHRAPLQRLHLLRAALFGAHLRARARAQRQGYGRVTNPSLGLCTAALREPAA